MLIFRNSKTRGLWATVASSAIMNSLTQNWKHIARLQQECHNSKFGTFLIIGTGKNVCRCTFNRYSGITQFAKLAARQQFCRRCTHRKSCISKNLKSKFFSFDTLVGNERYVVGKLISYFVKFLLPVHTRRYYIIRLSHCL